MSKLDDINAKVDRMVNATANVANDVRSLQAEVADLKAQLAAGSDIAAGLDALDEKLGAAADNLEAVAAIQGESVPTEPDPDDGLEPEGPLPPDVPVPGDEAE